MKPVIFLDVDGVVVTDDSMRLGGAKSADHRCVAHLNRIVEEADADVVISSSWRLAHSLDFIRSVLVAAGFRTPERVIGMTTHLHYRTENGRIVGRAERSDEIREWLRRHPRERFVIFDDDWDAEIPGHFVRTASEHGLTVTETEAALELLTRGGGDAQ